MCTSEATQILCMRIYTQDGIRAHLRQELCQYMSLIDEIPRVCVTRAQHPSFLTFTLGVTIPNAIDATNRHRTSVHPPNDPFVEPDEVSRRPFHQIQSGPIRYSQSGVPTQGPLNRRSKWISPFPVLLHHGIYFLLKCTFMPQQCQRIHNLMNIPECFFYHDCYICGRDSVRSLCGFHK